MSFKFFLLTENTFHASYLVTKWLEAFKGSPNSLGIALRENPFPEQSRKAREDFHQFHQGQKRLGYTDWKLLAKLYPDLSETERAMILSFGVPAHTATYDPDTLYLSKNINNPLAKQWLSTICTTSSKPFLFVFLDKILDPWWIDLTASQIINGHSAVLPYARGMFAIENVAVSQDAEHFRASAGATVHYVDTGIDTGPIIKGGRFSEPFNFISIWECKGHSFILAFDLLIQVACDISKRVSTVPIGTVLAPLLYGPNFRRVDFTPEKRKKAEIGYLNMKAANDRRRAAQQYRVDQVSVSGLCMQYTDEAQM